MRYPTVGPPCSLERFRAHAYVGILGDNDDGVIGPLNERSSQSCLSNVTVQHGKPLGLAVVLQNEVLAYFQTSPTDLAAGRPILRRQQQVCQALPSSPPTA